MDRFSCTIVKYENRFLICEKPYFNDYHYDYCRVAVVRRTSAFDSNQIFQTRTVSIFIFPLTGNRWLPIFRLLTHLMYERRDFCTFHHFYKTINCFEHLKTLTLWPTQHPRRQRRTTTAQQTSSSSCSLWSVAMAAAIVSYSVLFLPTRSRLLFYSLRIVNSFIITIITI